MDAVRIEPPPTGSEFTSSATLPELPDTLRKGLAVVSSLAVLSLVTSTALCVHLGHRLFTWKHRDHVRANQFVVLIFNLIIADVQQSVAFMINAHWVRKDSIVVGSAACWAQGWFISTGDLSSGLFTFAIATHSLADIVFDYRLSQRTFKVALAGIWIFNYACAGIGFATHSPDLYVRAGAWCWIDMRFADARLWLHYLWIIIAEFGTLVIYAFIFIVLRRRVRESFYTTSNVQLRAQTAAELIIAYPPIYVVCTLPLVVARLKTMAGHEVEFVELCVAAAMITSNGWLDVLLYSLSRHNLLFGPEMTNENVRALATFGINSNWRPDRLFGTTTTVEATLPRRPMPARFIRIHGDGQGSLKKLCDPNRLSIKAETMVHVSIETVELGAFSMHVGPIFEETAEGGDPSCIKGSLHFEMESPNEN